MTSYATPLPASLSATTTVIRWLGRSCRRLPSLVIGPLVIATGIQAAPPVEFAATPSPPAFAAESAGGPVQRIDDYAAATAAARQAQAMLLVSVEPAGGDPADLVGRHLERPDVQQRFATSGTPWVFCRVGMQDSVPASWVIPASWKCGAGRVSSSSTTPTVNSPAGSCRSCRGPQASIIDSARPTSTNWPRCRRARLPSDR